MNLKLTNINGTWTMSAFSPEASPSSRRSRTLHLVTVRLCLKPSHESRNTWPLIKLSLRSGYLTDGRVKVSGQEWKYGCQANRVTAWCLALFREMHSLVQHPASLGTHSPELISHTIRSIYILITSLPYIQCLLYPVGNRNKVTNTTSYSWMTKVRFLEV